MYIYVKAMYFCHENVCKLCAPQYILHRLRAVLYERLMGMLSSFDLFDRLHFAVTDSATVWCRFLNGAVQSGRRAAFEV